MKETLVVFKKELLEIFRDKSTLVILLIPLFIFPIFNVGMSFFNSKSETDIEISVACNSKEVDEIINLFIENNDTFRFSFVNSDMPEVLLKEGNIDCYLREKEGAIEFVYNSSSFDSLSSTAKLAENFQLFYNSFLSESYDNVFKIKLKDENGTTLNSVDSISSIFVPIVLVVLIFQGTSSFANDLFAGEKERKTLELLLLSGVKKQSIYCGKSLAMAALALLNLFISLVSSFATFGFSEIGLNQFKFTQNGNTYVNILYIVIILIELSFVAVFLSMTISMLSKNMKNSQLLNEIALTVPVGIMGLLLLGVIKNNAWFFDYIPLFNILVCLNKTFSGDLDISGFVISFISNILLIILLVIFSVRYMKSEKFIN